MKENKYKYITKSQRKEKQKKKNIFLFFVFLACVIIVLPLAVKISIRIDEESKLPQVNYDVTIEENSETVVTEDVKSTEVKKDNNTTSTTENISTECSTEVFATETDTDESIVISDDSNNKEESDSFTYSFGTVTNNVLEKEPYPSDIYLIYKYVVEEDNGSLPENDRGRELAFAIESFMSENINDSMDEYQKEKAIHDYLVSNTSYSYVRKREGYNSPKYTPYGVLLDHKAVCQGYAEAFELLCACCGIKCYVVSGKATNDDGTDGHAWNITEIDGNWYQVDVTWDDPIPEKYQNGISHEYFNISDEYISKNHEWNRENYPACPNSF